MFFYLNIKTRLLIAGFLVILGVFVLLHGFVLDQEKIPLAHGSASDNLRGWGWSEGTGWISLNCYNDYDDNGTFDNCCPGGNSSFCASYGDLAGGDYGVNFDTGSNKLSGWAWSDRVGWICFGESCTPSGTCDGGDNDDSACTTEADCPGGICAKTAPHGRTPWACVGKPDWPGGTLTCSGDAGEDFNNTANIVSQWKMNDTISDEATSDSVGTNTGMLKPTGSSVVRIKGKYGNSLKFDGSEDYIEVGDSTDISITGDLTFEAWVKRGAVGTEQTIAGKWDETTGAVAKSYRLFFDSANKLNFSVSDNTNTATITQNSKCIGGTSEGNTCSVDTDCAGTCIRGDNAGTACTSNTQCTGGGLCDKGVCKNAPVTDTKKWHHVAGKYVSGSSPYLRLFIDGRLTESTTTGTVPTVLTDLSQKLYFGAHKGASAVGSYFNGVMDNVSLWNRAKTGNEVFDDAHMEVSGWAKATSSKEGGWLSLRGYTKGDKIWGSYLKDYLGFYTLAGFMGERHNNERMSTNGLVAHWKFNKHTWDGTADEVVDGSGSNNHGTAQNGVTTIDKGIFGRAGNFDGTNDYVSRAVSGFRSSDASGTLSAWINLTDVSDYRYIVHSADEATGNYQLSISIQSTSGKLYVYQANNDTADYIVGSTNVADGNWHHIAVTSDGSSYILYVDGVAESLTVSSGTNSGDWFADTLNRDNIVIGANKRSTIGDYFKGMIDNVSIYSREKTPNEISADYERRNPYSMGWGDFDDDPPAPLSFDTLTLDSSVSCSQLLVQWEPSTWAESYSYWREQKADSPCDACTSDSTCTTSGYAEYSYLGTCSTSECSLSDTGLSENTGYCYSIEAHNETGDTFITDNPPSSSAPQWKSTTLCPVSTGMSIDNTTCGQLTVIWDAVKDDAGNYADGYNTYRALTSTGCDTSINDTNCEAVGHVGEALDYDADNDGTTDLVGHWKFNESSGTTVADSSGSSNTGTATDANTGNTDTDTPPSVETTALFSNARSFDGTDDYIDLPSVLDPNTTDFTVEFWFKMNDYSTKTEDQYIIAQEDDTTSGTGGQPWLFLNNSDNASATSDALASYLGGAYTDTGVAPTAGTWYHAALTKSGTTIKVYINSELKVTGTQTTEASDGGLRLGLSKADTNAFDGVIDNISIYNVAKTAEQIRIDYEAGDCGGTDCGVDSTGVVCHISGADTKCGKAIDDADACCFTDKRIVPFTNYYYKLSATNEAGESNGSSTTLSGQTICYPAPEAGEE